MGKYVGKVRMWTCGVAQRWRSGFDIEVKVERHTGRHIGRADSCEEAGNSTLARSESGAQVLVLRLPATG